MNISNEAFKDILYLISCVLEEDSDRNYGSRDSFLFKLHNSWQEFINNSPLGLDPYQTIKQSNEIKKEHEIITSYLDIVIPSEMNEKPWKYVTHCSTSCYSYTTCYMIFNSSWFYFDYNSRCWQKSVIKPEYLINQLKQSGNGLFQSISKLKKYLKKV